MSDEPGEARATALLDDLRALRNRTRADRRGYAVPLSLFGVLVLAAPLCYLPAEPPPGLREFELTAVHPGQAPFPQFEHVFTVLRYPGLVGWYWLLTIVGGLAVTGWWYRRRARRFGVEGDPRLAYAVAGAALVGFLLSEPVLTDVGRAFLPAGLYSTPAVTLPVLFGSAVLALAVLGWGDRPRRSATQRNASVVAGLVLAAVAFGAVGVYLIRGYAALLVIAVVVLGLAWAERSVLLGVVGALFTASALLTNLYSMENVFDGVGWSAGLDPRLAAAQNLVLPALLLLGGALAAVLGTRSAR